MSKRQQEQHRIGRIGWLRAAVLGANDGILSTASLVLGVATAHATHGNVLVAGVAGLVAGTMSMAAGEYVSVHLPVAVWWRCSGALFLARRWPSFPVLCDSVSSGGESDPPGRRHFLGIPRVSWRVGCTHGRSRHDSGRNARHVLGGAGHGDDRGRRGAVRNPWG